MCSPATVPGPLAADRAWTLLIGGHPAPARERGAAVAELAQLIERNAAELVMLDAIDGGHPVAGMHQDLAIAADTLRLFGGLAIEMKGSTMMASRSSRWKVATRARRLLSASMSPSSCSSRSASRSGAWLTPKPPASLAGQLACRGRLLLGPRQHRGVLCPYERQGPVTITLTRGCPDRAGCWLTDS
jgi:Aldehyde dehydrogenase family